MHFALTGSYKAQGLSLPHVILSVDENMFAEGRRQTYVAMNRATSLDKLYTYRKFRLFTN